ncbi:hypothetical protein F7725_013739 [Dissostichus mawsoni]|uniref:Uncharacterized protein n=1 Tax=Dissostichus mawsoni TaxID=36200 RepID=A0A7J5YW55_DISMA|nr:hypothetical protein F7725_013739 [Dissostichus mawsoni]
MAADKEVNLEQVHRRMNSLLDEDLVHKQIPDLCAGHRQHAAQPGLSDALGPRFDHLSARGGGSAASSTPPSPWGVHREDAPPVSGSWQQHVAPPPAPPPPPGSQHHAVQTQATQRGDFPSESWQDPHQMPISYQGVSAGPIPEAIDATHSTWRSDVIGGLQALVELLLLPGNPQLESAGGEAAESPTAETCRETSQ